MLWLPIREELQHFWKGKQREEGMGCLWNRGEAVLNFSFTAEHSEMSTGIVCLRDADQNKVSWDSSSCEG